eukprot:1159669-Pelagomonas_calceolata.AAC.4
MSVFTSCFYNNVVWLKYSKSPGIIQCGTLGGLEERFGGKIAGLKLSLNRHVARDRQAVLELQKRWIQLLGTGTLCWEFLKKT